MESKYITKANLIEKINSIIQNNEGSFSVVSADIDDFSNLNTLYGHPIGDVIIEKTISIFENNLSPGDLFSRNGDEFILLMFNKGTERTFMELEEIRRYLSDNTFAFEDVSENIYFTLSFGVANYPKDAKNSVELLRVADSALFRAKNLGKNRICLSEKESMVLKSNYFTKTQLERLTKLSKDNNKTEAFLLREALDDLFKKYSK